MSQAGQGQKPTTEVPAMPVVPPFPGTTPGTSAAPTLSARVPASGAVDDVTEGWDEIAKFLHSLIGEVATNARGFTSAVADAVDKVKGEVEDLKSKVGTAAPAVATAVTTAEKVPEIGPSVNYVVGSLVRQVQSHEERLLRIEEIGKSVLKVAGPLVEAVAKLGG